MKNAGKSNAAAQRLNGTITKLTQVSELLADEVIFAVVKQALQGESSIVRVRSKTNIAKRRSHGANVDAAFEIVEDMGYESFTKNDLAEKLGQAGHEIVSPRNAMVYPIQKLLDAGEIELVQRGGGKRATTYRKRFKSISIERPSPSAHDKDREGTEMGIVTQGVKQHRHRNEMEQIAFRCIEGLTKQFASHELINGMNADGYTFVGDAEITIQALLRRLVKDHIIDIVQPGDGRRPAIYERRNRE